MGDSYLFSGGIYALGQAAATSDFSEGSGAAVNSVTEQATAYTLIDTGGLDYTTLSGTKYLTSLPGNSVPDGAPTAVLLLAALAALAVAGKQVRVRG